MPIKEASAISERWLLLGRSALYRQLRLASIRSGLRVCKRKANQVIDWRILCHRLKAMDPCDIGLGVSRFICLFLDVCFVFARWAAGTSPDVSLWT
jgi:hypothetical protein